MGSRRWKWNEAHIKQPTKEATITFSFKRFRHFAIFTLRWRWGYYLNSTAGTFSKIMRPNRHEHFSVLKVQQVIWSTFFLIYSFITLQPIIVDVLRRIHFRLPLGSKMGEYEGNCDHTNYYLVCVCMWNHVLIVIACKRIIKWDRNTFQLVAIDKW